MNHFAFTPTPVTTLPYFSKILGVNLLSKRDDLFNKAGGGNKARMLQYILADVNSNNCDVLVTAGGPCSNFNRACALMCAELGIPMHLIEYTDKLDEFHTSLNYYLCNLIGIRKTRCEKNSVSENIKLVMDSYKLKGKKAVFCYGGGRSLQGFFSYYEAVRELKEQNVPVDDLFIACGTGTTLTGICAGMSEFYSKAHIHAISTARLWNTERSVLYDNMRILNEYLHTNYNFSNLVFSDKYLCGGYAQYNADLASVIKECISKEGLIIDPTYSGKAFYGMKTMIEDNKKYAGKNILFWNTGGVYNLLSSRLL